MSGVESKARELLEARLASVRVLETAVAELERAKEAVAAAERGVSEAWSAATKGGWTEAELRTLGLGTSRTTRRAPRRRQHSPKAESPDTAASAAPES